MNETNDRNRRPENPVPSNPQGEPRGTEGHSGHRWMMIACCVPMLIIAGALVLTGSVSIGGLVFALGCVVMMAAMMFAPGHRH